MKHDNQSIQIIADYLMKQADNDNQLKKAIGDMKVNKKTLDDMWSYIVGQAKQQLNGINGAIEESTVFGWAIHYMTEPNESLEIPVITRQTDRKTSNETKTVAKQKNVTLSKGFINTQQLSLFDDEV